MESLNKHNLNVSKPFVFDFGVIDLSSIKGIEFEASPPFPPLDLSTISASLQDLDVSQVIKEEEIHNKISQQYEKIHAPPDNNEQPPLFSRVQDMQRFIAADLPIHTHPIKHGSLHFSATQGIELTRKNKKWNIAHEKLAVGGNKAIYVAKQSVATHHSIYIELREDVFSQVSLETKLKMQNEFKNEIKHLKYFRDKGEEVILKIEHTVKNLSTNVIGENEEVLEGAFVEHCSHGDLNDFMESGIYEELSDDEKWQLLEDCAHGLALISKHHVIHHDIKPENFLVNQDESSGKYRIKLADFGYAENIQEVKNDPTKPPRFLGTPVYMPPEFYKGHMDILANPELVKNEQWVDSNLRNPRSDLFSMGVVLYNMRNANMNPEILHVVSKDPWVAMKKTKNLTQDKIKDTFSNKNDALNDLNKRLMSINPEDRPSAKEFYEEVKRLRAAKTPWSDNFEE